MRQDLHLHRRSCINSDYALIYASRTTESWRQLKLPVASCSLYSAKFDWLSATQSSQVGEYLISPLYDPGVHIDIYFPDTAAAGNCRLPETLLSFLLQSSVGFMWATCCSVGCFSLVAFVVTFLDVLIPPIPCRFLGQNSRDFELFWWNFMFQYVSWRN